MIVFIYFYLCILCRYIFCTLKSHRLVTPRNVCFLLQMIVPFSFFSEPIESTKEFGPKKAWPKNVDRPQATNLLKGLFRILGKSLRNHSEKNPWTSRVSFVFRCPTDVLVLPRGPRLQWLRMPEEWLLLTQGGRCLFLRWGGGEIGGWISLKTRHGWLENCSFWIRSYTSSICLPFPLSC